MKLTIPSQFQRPPFYVNGDVIERHSSLSFEEILLNKLFYYDLTEELKPWQDKQTYLPCMFELWKEKETELIHFFKERNTKAAKKPMSHMLALFINALFWTNHQPVCSLVEVETKASDLLFKPVNIEERLSFLLAGPERYHSFVQLKAMMTELEKIYAKSVVIEAVQKG